MTSREDLMANLERANVVRSRRARLKEHISAGDLRVSEVLLADKVHLRTMKVADLMLAVPNLGPAKVNSAFRALRISPSVTLENFAHSRRLELLDYLHRRYGTVKL